MKENTICLLNDSFPPQIDGVANAVLNYAKQITHSGNNAVVITPDHPQASDAQYPFPVVRYKSVNFSKMDTYKVGLPFSPKIARETSQKQVSLLHSHCPIISTFVARELRQITDAPIVLTYHTKFDVDIDNVIKNKMLQSACQKALVANISACDEVWAVSNGAGENLRALGYEGDYVVMPNGVDMPRERVDEDTIAATTKEYNLSDGIPVYLFVGRMMWYKGIRIILDALAILNAQRKDFRMVFVGDGDDNSEIQAYAALLGLGDKCLFIGPLRDRDALRAWYCRGDLFLFPSTFDTNGLVVREAAANCLPSVMIRGSAASEGIIDGKNGFLIEENAENLCQLLLKLYDQDAYVKSVGQAAADEIYFSWNASVRAAMTRYEIVIDRYRSGLYAKNRKPIESILKMNGDLMEVFAKLSSLRQYMD